MADELDGQRSCRKEEGVMQREPLEGTQRSPQQEAADKNAEQREKSARKKEERQKQLRRIIITVIFYIAAIGLAVIFSIYPWTSIEAAEAVAGMMENIMGAGIILELPIVYLAKKKRFGAHMPISLVVLLLAVLVSDTFASGELKKNENAAVTDGNKTTFAAGTGSAAKESESVLQTDAWEPEEFDWGEDWFIIGLSSYCRSCMDEQECIRKLLTEFAFKYVYDDSSLGTRSKEELDKGDYGKYISEAENYDKQYGKVDAIPLKITARQEELYYRELADGESHQYDNLKIMGDIHKELIKLQGLTGTDKVDELKEALSCYINALPLAYWNDAGKDYYLELWRELSWGFTELENCGAYTDNAYKGREEVLAAVTGEFAINPPIPDAK